jgi:hypothetical protein
MEGTNFTESMKKQLSITDGVEQPVAPLPASGAESATAHLIVGEEYKITGGKYKKYKTGVLQCINNTYSDVKIITDNPIEGIKVDKVIKVKNTYLMRLNPPGIEMPDESDLLNVPDLDEYMKDHPELEINEIENPPNQEVFVEDEPEFPNNCQRCELLRIIGQLEIQLKDERMFSKMLLDKITK